MRIRVHSHEIFPNYHHSRPQNMLLQARPGKALLKATYIQTNPCHENHSQRLGIHSTNSMNSYVQSQGIAEYPTTATATYRIWAFTHDTDSMARDTLIAADEAHEGGSFHNNCQQKLDRSSSVGENLHLKPKSTIKLSRSKVAILPNRSEH